MVSMYVCSNERFCKRDVIIIPTSRNMLVHIRGHVSLASTDGGKVVELHNEVVATPADCGMKSADRVVVTSADYAMRGPFSTVLFWPPLTLKVVPLALFNSPPLTLAA